MATIDEIKQQAAAVKNATQVGENTAERVGGALAGLAELAEQHDSKLIDLSSVSFSYLFNFGFIDKDGNIETSHTDWRISLWLKVNTKSYIKILTNNLKNGVVSYITTYGENKRKIKSYLGGSSELSKGATVTFNEDEKYIRLCLGEEDNVPTLYLSSDISILSYQDLQDSVSSLSNMVRPLNILNGFVQYESGNFINHDEPNKPWASTEMVVFNDNDYIEIENDNFNTAVSYITTYNENKEVVRKIQSNGRYTKQDGEKYVRISDDGNSKFKINGVLINSFCYNTLSSFVSDLQDSVSSFVSDLQDSVSSLNVIVRDLENNLEEATLLYKKVYNSKYNGDCWNLDESQQAMVCNKVGEKNRLSTDEYTVFKNMFYETIFSNKGNETVYFGSLSSFGGTLFSINFETKEINLHYTNNGENISDIFKTEKINLENVSKIKAVYGKFNRNIFVSIYNDVTKDLIYQYIDMYTGHSTPRLGWLYERNMIFSTAVGTKLYSMSAYAYLPKTCDYLILGDSITEGDKLGNDKETYAELLSSNLGNTVISSRCGGTIDQCYAFILSYGAFLSPKYVILTIGTNGGNGVDKLETIYSKIKEFGGKLLVNYVPKNSSGSYIEANKIISQFLENNKECTGARLDIATSIGNDEKKGYNTDLFVDGVHPNQNGHIRIWQEIMKTIGGLFISKYTKIHSSHKLDSHPFYGKKVCVLGDSITHNGDDQEHPNQYGKIAIGGYLKKYSDLTGAIVYSYGMGGTHIGGGGNNSFISRVNDIRSDADVIMILGGTNDFGHSSDGHLVTTEPFGNVNEAPTDQTYCGSIHCICRELQQKHPNAMIIWITPLHHGIKADTPEWEVDESGDLKYPLVENRNFDTQKTFREYVDAIKTIAQYYSLYIIDAYTYSGISSIYDINNNFADGLHPTDRGNDKLASFLAASTKNIEL